MATGNIFQGTAKGKLGDVVLTRRNGKQVSRVRVRTISNPRSFTQILQRVVIATTGKAYSLFSPLADHSFQGKTTKFANMQRFQQLNTRLLTGRANDAYNAGTLAQVGDYVAKNGQLPVVNNYVVSEGSAPSSKAQVSGLSTEHIILPSGANTPSYGSVIEANGLKQGDQLTFVTGIADKITGELKRIMFCRVILNANDGELEADFLDGTAISNPNPRNEGTGSYNFTKSTQGQSIYVTPKESTYDTATEELAGGCVIVSRLENNTWYRSNTTFEAVAGTRPLLSLQAAIDSWMNDTKSSKYLNQSQSVNVVF